MRVKAVDRHGDQLRLIDQTRLPGEVIYHDYDDYHEIIAAIRRLEVRGAPAIGIAAAYGLAVGVLQMGDFGINGIDKVAADIKAARPTAVNLTWAVDRVMQRLRAQNPQGREAVMALLWSEAETIHEEDRAMCDRIGKHGAALIKDGDNILTHCNTGALATGGSGTALAVIYACRDEGKKIHVYADETRPLLQGARLTSWELHEEGIPVTLICDNTAASLMAQGKVQQVIVGADRIAGNGDTANKIGTYGVAVLAKFHGVPFYIAAPMSTFDQYVASGRDIPIEQRNPDEVTKGFCKGIAPEGVKAYNAAFDVTPNELITGFITDQGVRAGGRKD